MAIQPELRFPNINQLILALQYQRDVEEVDVFLKKRKWRRAGLVAGIVLAAGGLCAAALGILRSRQSEARILQEAAIEAWIPVPGRGRSGRKTEYIRGYEPGISGTV